MVGLMQPFFSILSDIQKLHRPETVDLQELWNVSRSLDGRLQAFWVSENPHQGPHAKDEIDMGTVCKYIDRSAALMMQSLTIFLQCFNTQSFCSIVLF